MDNIPEQTNGTLVDLKFDCTEYNKNLEKLATKVSVNEQAQKMLAYLDSDEYYAITEEQVSSGSIGFGNPHSKLTALQQFRIWREMRREGLFLSADEFRKTMCLGEGGRHSLLSEYLADQRRQE